MNDTVRKIGVSDRTLDELERHAFDVRSEQLAGEVALLRSRWRNEAQVAGLENPSVDVRKVGVTVRMLRIIGQHALALPKGHPVRDEAMLLMTRYERASKAAPERVAA